LAHAAAKRVRRDWTAVIAAQAASGQTATAFCRREHIPESRFFAWRQRLRRATPAPAAPAFVEVRRPLPAVPTASGVTLVTPDGWRVELGRDFDAATLERALACAAAQGPCSA
jgi:hypothetical protein